ncbi:unnamed protein product [Owenia fusiformis]|uniref:sphingomyelin phosphodiesterase n=1 Tax=Owenia fusiformis TaxID=6347 RepID=A0A8J1TDW0_OWEFU|nr:unnamed protein product [Owenia fusiformis]
MLKLLYVLLVACLWGLTLGQGGEGEECPCVSGASCHPLLNTCFSDPAPVDVPHIWIGNAPNCDGTQDKCAIFDLDFDTSHPRGDNGSTWCTNGTKVRCLAKPAPPLNDPTPANTMNIVSYNIWERDSLASHDGQRERSCRIPRFLLTRFPDLDIIVMEEAFMGGCWPRGLDLRDLLKFYGFPYITDTIDAPNDFTKFENGGVFIASRWPILEQDQVIFDNSPPGTTHHFTALGAGYSKVNKTVNGTSKMYHIFGTHTASSGSNQVRVDQARAVYNLQKSKSIPVLEPVLYAGDFNVNYYNPNISEPLLYALNANVPAIPTNSEIYTFDPDNNDLLNTTGGSRQWLDYVVYSSEHLAPVSSQLVCFLATAPSVFPVCWCHDCAPFVGYRYPYAADCASTRRILHLSDHHPVIGTFIF